MGRHNFGIWFLVGALTGAFCMSTWKDLERYNEGKARAERFLKNRNRF